MSSHEIGTRINPTFCKALHQRGVVTIDSSKLAFDFFVKLFSSDVEEFWVVALNSGLKVLDRKLLFRGTADSCPIHPRDLIRFLCVLNATSFVIAHNHPSGDPTPSRQDIEVTQRLFELTRLLEIPMKDHLVLGEESYFSFADSGFLNQFARGKLPRRRATR